MKGITAEHTEVYLLATTETMALRWSGEGDKKSQTNEVVTNIMRRFCRARFVALAQGPLKWDGVRRGGWKCSAQRGQTWKNEGRRP